MQYQTLKILFRQFFYNIKYFTHYQTQPKALFIEANGPYPLFGWGKNREEGKLWVGKVSGNVKFFFVWFRRENIEKMVGAKFFFIRVH